MEQRSLRLGDIVDDYCPRERRVTNHAIVALVGNSIRQTRCSTCDAEHEYKEAKVPKKRGKGDSSEVADLSGGVLVTSKPAASGTGADDIVENGTTEVAAAPAAATPPPTTEAAAPAQEAEDQNGNHSPGDNAQPDGWFSHRPLIRASLPRTDGEPPPARAIPEFTMHQRHGRGFGGRGGFRHGHQAGGGQYRGGNGHNHNQHNQSYGNGNEPDGNRAPHPGRPGGGGRRRRRRRPR